MPRFLVPLALLLVLLPVAARSTVEIEVASFNIAKGQGLPNAAKYVGDKYLKMIVPFVKEISPDAIGGRASMPMTALRRGGRRGDQGFFLGGGRSAGPTGGLATERWRTWNVTAVLCCSSFPVESSTATRTKCEPRAGGGIW